MSMSERRSAWERRVAEQEASGLSTTAWCAREGVNKSTFAYWRQRLKEKVAEPGGPEWVAVSTAGTMMSTLTLRVGAVLIDVTPGFDRVLLTEVLGVLEARC